MRPFLHLMTSDILITGIPRSGTTLLTSLLSKQTECVAFSEPEWMKTIRAKSATCLDFVHHFDHQRAKIRSQISRGQPIAVKVSRFNEGLPENYYHRNNQGQVLVDKEEQLVTFPQSYSEQPFVFKANAQFTACLKPLINTADTQLIAVIRNPIATIMSWRSLDLPISKGHVKVAEKYSSDFHQHVTCNDDLLIKQVQIIDWFFHQYLTFINQIKLVKYEDLVANTNSVISSITGNSDVSCKKLSSQNNNRSYNHRESDLIKSALIKHGTYHKKFYPMS